MKDKLQVNESIEPLDVCYETVACLLSLGTLNELVVHQPENVKYKDQKQEIESRLKAHLIGCQKCKNALYEKYLEN